MKTNNKIWMTLVELVVAISISTMIMMSVTVFVSSMMKTSNNNQKILDALGEWSVFDLKIRWLAANIVWQWIFYSWNTIWTYDTWIFLQTKSPSLPVTFLWIKDSTWFCNAGTPNENDIVKRLTIKELSAPDLHKGTVNYKIDYLNNTITKWWIPIVWTSWQWDKIDTSSGRLTELNNPSAIIEHWTYLIIADTGNNRILTYDSATDKINILAWIEDWINMPTDIYYDTSDNSLIIANSWDWKVLKLSKITSSLNNINLWIKLNNNISFDSIKFSFEWVTDITWPTSTGDFIFDPAIVKNIADTVSTWSNILTYNLAATSNLIKWIEYNFGITWITPPATSWNWNYSVKLEFLLGWNIVYNYYYTYYIDWSSILDSKNVKIIVLEEGDKFPNSITSGVTWSKEITDWTGLLNNSMARETASYFPIKEFSYEVNWNILSIKYIYYKLYDCFWDNHLLKEKVYISKIN